MNELKIKEVFSDEAFVSSLLEMETVEEVQAAVSAKGIELTIADIEALRTQLSEDSEELSEDALENVAGGFVITAGVVSAIAGCISAAAGVTSMVHTVTNRRW